MLLNNHSLNREPVAEVPGVLPERETAPSPRSRRRGPKTPVGRARVGVNAITHGLSSLRPVVPGESPMDWELHRQTIVDALVPVGPVELALAERIASALWRLRRVAAYEEAALAERQDLATPSARLLPHPLDLDKIIRFEAHLNRQLYQALHELESRRAERRGESAPLVRVDVHHQMGTPETVEG
jgi:hypothetical protein